MSHDEGAWRLRVGRHVITTRTTGSGPAALLLHGWPQTAHAWRHVVPLLAPHRTLVVPDLLGFGSSSRPTTGYEKRAVAAGLRELMDVLGHATYDVVGHDLGGQVAYPLVAEGGGAARTLTFVEAGVPGLGASVQAANPLTGGSWHFGFNMVPDLPETLLTGRERAFLHWIFRRDSLGLVVDDAIDDADLDHYARALAAPGAIRSSLGHYRALPQDLVDNVALAAAGRLDLPTLVVGARQGIGHGWLDTVEAVAHDVTAAWVEDSGHYVPEEQPLALSRLLLAHWGITTEEGR